MFSLMPLKRSFRNTTLNLGLAHPTDQELLVRSYVDFVHDMDMENHLNKTRWQRQIGLETSPLLDTFGMRITKDKGDHLIGLFTVRDSVTKNTDEISFTMRVSRQENGHLEKHSQFHPDETFSKSRDPEGRHVKVTSPNWKFPRFITDPINRRDMIAFLKGGIKDRTNRSITPKAHGLS